MHIMDFHTRGIIMTKITKHYHGFEVTIEPVDGYELIESDWGLIEENIISYDIDVQIFIEAIFFEKVSGDKYIDYCAFYRDHQILAKIEAKRMPKCRKEHWDGKDGIGAGHEVRECPDCHKVEWFKCREDASIQEKQEPITVGVLSEILERLDNIESNIKVLDMDLFKLKYGKDPS